MNVTFFARLVSTLALAAGFSACSNYTEQPVCNQDNAVIPPGLTGVYTISVQKDDFTAETQTITIGVGKSGRTLLWHKADGDEESSICAIGGYFIQESYEEKVHGWSQSRLYVTGMGLSIVPLFYDKASLDTAGIPNKIIELPEGARTLLGVRLSRLVETAASHVRAIFDQAASGLVVDNHGIPGAQLMRHALPGPVGLNLFRQ